MRRGSPAGIPLGRALDIPKGIAYDDLREAVAAIDRVHGDGELPWIPVRLITGIERRGLFRFDERTGAPLGIVVRADQDHVQFTFLHEIGHFLDLCAFGQGGEFGTAVDPIFEPWSIVIAASRAYQRLTNYAQTGYGDIVANDGSRLITPLPPFTHAASLGWISAAEAWARSYAQYVAIKSGLSTANRSLEAFRQRTRGTMYYPLQWDDDDFRPIEAAIDGLMRAMRWQA